jgi:hypothetical protein
MDVVDVAQRHRRFAPGQRVFRTRHALLVGADPEIGDSEHQAFSRLACAYYAAARPSFK